MLGQDQSLSELTSNIIDSQEETHPCPDSLNVRCTHHSFHRIWSATENFSSEQIFFIDSCQNVSTNITKRLHGSNKSSILPWAKDDQERVYTSE